MTKLIFAFYDHLIPEGIQRRHLRPLAQDRRAGNAKLLFLAATT